MNNLPSERDSRARVGTVNDDWVSRLVEQEQRDEPPTDDGIAEPSRREKSAPPAPESALFKRLTIFFAAAIGLELVGTMGYVAFRGEPARAEYHSPEHIARVAPGPSSSSDSLSGEVIVAKQGGLFSSLGEALQRVSPYTRIIVRPGTYRESVLIDKPVEIVGDGPRAGIIFESGSGAVFTMRAEHATVRGLTIIRDVGVQTDNAHGVHIPQGRLVMEDCDITARQGHGVVVQGFAAEPYFVRCAIHGAQADGLRVIDAARGRFENCEFFDYEKAGAAVESRANPTFTNCTWRGGKGNAINIRAGNGRFLGCTVRDCSGHSVIINENAAPLFRGCTIEDGKRVNDAVLIRQANGARFEHCAFSTHFRGVNATDGAVPYFFDCRFEKNSSGGFGATQGGGLFDQCEFVGNVRPDALAGFNGSVAVSGGATHLRGCRIRDGNQSGVLLGESAEGILEDCEILRMTTHGAQIGYAATAVFLRSKFEENREAPVNIDKESRAVINHCSMRGNGRDAQVKNSRAVFRNSMISDGNLGGLSVVDLGHATVDDCRFSNFKTTCLSVSAGGRTYLTRCQLTDAQKCAVESRQAKQCSLNDCVISRCGMGVDQSDSQTSLCQTKVESCRADGAKYMGGFTLLDGCEFRDNAPHVQLRDNARGMLVRSKFADSIQHGIVLAENSNATMHDCWVSGNRGTNVFVTANAEDQGSDATLSHCQLHAAGSEGFAGGSNGHSTLVKCEITASQGRGAFVFQKHRTSILGGFIRDGRQLGILVNDSAQVDAADCEISGHALSNVGVQGSARCWLQGCQVKAGKQVGILVTSGGLLARDCEITDAGYDGVQVQNKGQARLDHCAVRTSTRSGVVVSSEAGATLNACNLLQNRQTGIAVVNALARLTECSVQSNVEGGAQILEQGDAVIVRGLFANNGIGLVARGNTALRATSVRFQGDTIAVKVTPTGKVNLQNCTAHEATGGVWAVEPGGSLTGSGNTPALPEP